MRQKKFPSTPSLHPFSVSGSEFCQMFLCVDQYDHMDFPLRVVTWYSLLM